MPTYCYETDDGTVHTRFFEMGAAPDAIQVDGQTARRSYRSERVGVPATSGWPIECYASGVHASQAKELEDYLAKRGVPTEVTKDGDPIYTSAKHQRKALKARGMHNRDSYFG